MVNVPSQANTKIMLCDHMLLILISIPQQVQNGESPPRTGKIHPEMTIPHPTAKLSQKAQVQHAPTS